jgi:hypothetical protein
MFSHLNDINIATHFNSAAKSLPKQGTAIAIKNE